MPEFKTGKLIKKSLIIGACSIAWLAVAAPSFAVPLKVNQASPKSGFDLGGGLYASLIGVSSVDNTTSLGGQTIQASDLFSLITAGSVSGFYYAAGNPGSGTFDNISLFAPFVSDTVTTGTNANWDRAVFDSLYMMHTADNVVFNWGSGTGTISITENYVREGNPFQTATVSEPSIAALFGMGLLGLMWRRRKSAA